MMRPMLIEVALPVPVDEVWAHLREPALIRRWFGWDYDGLEREIEGDLRGGGGRRRGRTHAGVGERRPLRARPRRRGQHQLGVVVAGLGDGLLVAVEKPGAAAFLTLSGYGEHAATLPLHTARWDGWWAELASY
jgi:hypothetical protein